MNTIVIGSLNTDIVATGIKQFPKAGQHVYGKELRIGPGGKSRNIADMIARLSAPNSVAIISRTVQDPYGLWRPPLDALAKAGVDTTYVQISDYKKVGKLPSVALIPVDEDGNNQIFVLPGVGDDFSSGDIDKAAPLFQAVSANKGMFVLTLECPLLTAVYAVKRANENGLKVVLDPGGLADGLNVDQLLAAGIFMIKPNEHEAKMLTGIEVSDFASAQKAAQKLQQKGIANVLITHGKHGAYLFSKTQQKHIPIPDLKIAGEKDETGCGDQTTATLCAYLQAGKSFESAAALAVLAGTLQFHKSGIQPITKKELEAA